MLKNLHCISKRSQYPQLPSKTEHNQLKKILFQETLKQFFPSWYHVKRYEEVLIFTCGLMSDPRPLIEHVGEMLVERETLIVRGGDDKREAHLKTMGKSSLLLNLIKSLYTEVSIPLESKPHHNEMFHFYSHEQDDICGRARDITPIGHYSRLYLFESLRACAPHYNIKAFGKSHMECVVSMHDISGSVANDLLLTCRKISQSQSITDLEMEGFHCDLSQAVRADVLRVSKSAQSIKIANSTLPLNFVEHLMRQLQQCKHLTAIHLENIKLYNSKENT